MKIFKLLFHSANDLPTDIALLIMRVGVGLSMAFGHGLGKVMKFYAGGDIQWADPIGIGPTASLFLASSAEFFCSLALALGLLTRVSVLPLAFTMCVAFFIVHGADPFAKKELALLYLIPYVTLFFAGAGRFSADGWIQKRLEANDVHRDVAEQKAAIA